MRRWSGAACASRSSTGLPGRLGPLLELLAEARLVTVSGGYVEVAHEALFREWPRLRDWLGEDREGRALQRRLALAAEEWQDESRDPALLWTGAPARRRGRGRRGAPDELTEVERAFVEAGRGQARDRRAGGGARRRPRRRGRTAGSGCSWPARSPCWRRRWWPGCSPCRRGVARRDAARTATRAAVAADAKRLAASALSLEQPDLALLTAVEATRLEQSPETYGAVLTLLGRHPDVVTRVSTDSSFMDAAADPRGRAVYLVQETPEVWAVEPQTGERLWTVELDAMGTTVSVSPDGSRIAVLRGGQVGTGARPRGGRSAARATSSGGSPSTQLARWTGAATVPYVWEYPAWQQDGTLAVATDTHVVAVAPDGSSAQQPGLAPARPGHGDASWCGGTAVVSTGASGVGPGVVLGRSGASRTLPAGVSIGAVSPGTGLAAATREGATGTELVILDARTLRERAATPAVDGVVSFLRYSPDGASLAAGVDERIELRDGASGVLVSPSPARARTRWGPPGRAPTATSCGRPGARGRRSRSTSPAAREPSPPRPRPTTRGPERVRRTPTSRSGPPGTTSAPTSRSCAGPGDRRGLRLPLTGLDDCACEVTSTDVTADGRTALGGLRVLSPLGGEVPDRGYVVAWDVATRRVRAVVDTPWPVLAVDAAADGGVAVLQGGSGWSTLDLGVMRLGDQVPLPAWTRLGWGTALAEVAPDGRRAVLLRGADALVVSMEEGRVLTEATVDPGRDGSLISAAWSADGEALALGSVTGWLYVVDGTTLDAHETFVACSPAGRWATSRSDPDGRLAATIEGADGDVVLWDTGTWRPYGQAVLRDHGQGFLHFDPDASYLHVVSGRAFVRVWRPNPPRGWRRRASPRTAG